MAFFSFFLFILGVIAVFQFVCLLIYVIVKLTAGRCTCNTYLGGKTALITGGNSGLGYQTALALAGRGCRVIIADRADCQESIEKIKKETGNENVIAMQFDLASLASIRKLAKEIMEKENRLDILVNNAAAPGLGNCYSEDNLHKVMQINHFGPFLLTNMLLDLMKKSAPSRIIFISSLLSFTNNLSLANLNYPEEEPASSRSEFFVYSNSKLCNLITAKQLSKKLLGTGITVNSVHPGIVYTNIYDKVVGLKGFVSKMFFYFLSYCSKTPQEGAQTAIHLALSKELEMVTGKFFIDCKMFFEPPKAYNEEFCQSIWDASEKFVT